MVLEITRKIWKGQELKNAYHACIRPHCKVVLRAFADQRTYYVSELHDKTWPKMDMSYFSMGVLAPLHKVGMIQIHDKIGKYIIYELTESGAMAMLRYNVVLKPPFGFEYLDTPENMNFIKRGMPISRGGDGVGVRS
jgi:hypothetical protein